MRLVDGVVSPNGLLLFGSEKTLDVEFANVPNRSGSPFDRYLLGSYPELCASTDRSVIMTKFECSAEGRQWSYVAAQPVLDRLSKKRLLAVDHGCLPALAHDITGQAMAAPTAERMVAAICKVLPVQPPWSSYYLAPDQVALCRLLRLAAYANDAYADDATAFDALATLGDKRLGPASNVSFFGNLFVVSPPPAAWFASRAPRMLPTLLLARLLAFTQAGTAGDDLPAIIAQARAGLGNNAYESLRPVLLRCDLLANRLDAMRADFVGRDDDRLALDGTMAFL
ncbi:hypothetical protein BAL199_30739, partial [alpha proteobacterium BAL199]